MNRARRVPALSISNCVDCKRLVRQIGAEVGGGGGGIALLLVSNAQVECISQSDRMAGSLLTILN